MAEQVSLDDIEHVYRANGAAFLRLVLARTGDLDAARDAVQEGFARAIRARGSYRREGSLAAWIARCVITSTYDLQRRTLRAAPLADVEFDVGKTEADLALSGVETRRIRAAVSRLPQRQRDVLFLRFFLDFDYATIAETLGIEVGTVSATLHAARASLAESLQEVT
jgi:RNA polymerase sigma factor (sigma-70 family)